MTQAEPYRPIPVQFAAEISDRFAKDVVAIVALDSAHDMMHITTYGRTAATKLFAAELGESINQHLSRAPEQKRTFSDFREPNTAARNAELAGNYWRMLRHLLNANAIDPDFRAEVETLLQTDPPAGVPEISNQERN